MGKFHRHNTRSAKLTPEQVIRIRHLYHVEGKSQGWLCHEFGMSIAQIGKIVRNECWTNIDTMQEADPVRLGHAEPVELPKELQEKLLAELSQLPSPPATDYPGRKATDYPGATPETADPVEAYLKREKGEDK